MYEFDWQRYEQAVRLSTRLLDNVIDANKYPVDEIDKNTKLTRRIGLGIMGIADLLFLLRIPYISKEGYEFMNKLAEAISY
jgi:ribonucleoside-diphosphate reductase alpha chain